MPTIARILQLAPASSYLASNYKDQTSVFNPSGRGKSTKNQAILIYIYWKILNKIYEIDPNYDGLQAPADYLYELEMKFAFKAGSIVDGGGGGSVTPITPSGINYPFYIHSSDFESDGVTYLNDKIAGVNIALFINEYVQQFFPGVDFTYVPTGGFVITAPGFDANNFEYTIRVERYFPIPT